MRSLLHEQRLASPDMGMLHVISEDFVGKDIIDTLEYAAMILYYQYEAGRIGNTDICVQYLRGFDVAIASGLDLIETYKQVYLTNPIELVNFFYHHPECVNEIYLMSDLLHLNFHDLLRNQGANLFDDLVKSVFEQDGLIYAVIFADHFNKEKN